MKGIIKNDFMRQTLLALLTESEALNMPFYCSLGIKNSEPVICDCFIDLIGNDLLVAAMYDFALVSSDRIPFYVKTATIKKTFLSSHDITIQFANGSDIRIIVDEKPLFGKFSEQRKNVLAFIDKLLPYLE
jgi:hypothetical protein